MSERRGFDPSCAAEALRGAAATLRAGPTISCAENSVASDAPLEMIMVQTPTGAAMRVPVRRRLAPDATVAAGMSDTVTDTVGPRERPCEGAPHFDDALAAAPQLR